MLYEFELSHNAEETAKNICCVKDEGAVDHNSITRWLKKFRRGCKNFDDQGISNRPKSVDSKALLSAKEANLASCTQRESIELGILQSPSQHSKIFKCCQIVPHITKILQNFWLSFVFKQTSTYN